MHALIPACCGSFLQPSASAHLRGQVRNGPRDACTYACVLRFVFAAFTHHCVYVCLCGFVWVQEVWVYPTPNRVTGTGLDELDLLSRRPRDQLRLGSKCPCRGRRRGAYTRRLTETLLAIEELLKELPYMIPRFLIGCPCGRSIPRAPGGGTHK